MRCGLGGRGCECLEVAIDIERTMVGNVKGVLLENDTVFLDVEALVTKEKNMVDRGELRSTRCRTALIFAAFGIVNGIGVVRT